MMGPILCAAFLAVSVFAQSSRPTNFSEFWNVTTYPNAQLANVSEHLYQASGLAGDDLDDHFQRRCIMSQVYDELSSNAQAPGFVPPIEAFDGVFFVGQSAVSAWAISTTSGLVVIDSINNAEEAEQILMPSIQTFGFTGDDIAAVIITHEHFDHYGGARSLQDTFSAPVYASELAWQAMEVADGGPLRDIVVTDGQEVDFGNFSVRFVATPGHTPGAMSLVFPVSDHGTPHIAGMNGVAGIASNASAKEDQIESYAKLAAAARETGVDTLIANHQTQDRSLTNFDLLNARQCAPDGCVQANPFVIGTDAFVRYLEIQALCARVQAARSDQSLSVES
ncbi:hypothetical protein M409DRAFT_55926 [Zasmidium cellare ATCC 36951]|uniref:Metallo-beta-lactamase domain-containing protein n=1 Tax=Zasmidium cellare ATCC 36951 TaxID=1080233 RepID=A0A6A6CEC1_ZASCE|nr:uncharacterized protein M409DRAFT_55926 [Zasmidium cellare ATCC 36951]KAF2165554.1 hypothetical protein M409DRAFT_55926 [Zasmidium cellare ATCC 36951]